MRLTNSQKGMLVAAALLALPLVAGASATDGIILDHYAWGEDTGWVNFAPAGGDIQVTDSGLTGYAWDANYGWINLAPSSAGVKNDGTGDLSGYAWSSGGGYIDFSGVTIDSSGVFHGTATGSVYGRLSFDCDNCSVTTDWRPAAANSGGSGGGSSSGVSGGGSSISSSGSAPAGFFASIAAPIQNIINDLVGAHPNATAAVAASSSLVSTAPALSGGWDLVNPAIVPAGPGASTTTASSGQKNPPPTNVGGWLANIGGETALFILLVLVVCSVLVGYVIYEYIHKRTGARRRG